MWGSRLVGKIKWALKLPLFFKNSHSFLPAHKNTPPRHIETMTTTNKSKAKLSFYIDILSTLSILILCSSWIYSLSYPAHPLLSRSFLQNGFCLSPLFDNTHWRCSQFDAVCGILCLLLVMVGEETVGIDRSGGILLCSFVWAL
jgi:hypothetical protein